MTNAAVALAIGFILGALLVAIITMRPSNKVGRHRSGSRRHSPATRGYDQW